ncbi:peptide chain release factor N(5)-glutamine methyltransferase [Aureibaculum marinum]|uniref:peptide chain release factor N(5)-glutamine methyltransferase n=1 Tax=Aureibaculum marinum TaxID=2487930 RepID=A0A3N4P3D8_9FLAO|nr:peptide chain release factor N(5)-glutamine methyltransferase [Aureibaculum marinum]RPE00919.1 peptide chain release factor N(5)-glutamine methyltransferase [Aureibaculum marinum]
MTLASLKSVFFKELNKIYTKEEVLSFYYILVKEYLDLEKSEVFLKPELQISKTQVTLFNNSILALKQEKPIQYIIGKTYFYSLTFKVNKNVLIPRPETEELVAWILSEVSNKNANDTKSNLNILDIGTGSGCIAISLAKNLKLSEVFAIDISKKALYIAKQNAELNKTKVNFLEQDILNLSKTNPILNSQKYDVIVSNPPYVRELEKQEIKNNVLLNEPHLALFVKDNNPLLFYNKIADFALKNLTEYGKIFFEINQYLASETVNLLKQKGFENIELRTDLFGNKRMIKASIKSNL